MKLKDLFKKSSKKSNAVVVKIDKKKLIKLVGGLDEISVEDAIYAKKFDSASAGAGSKGQKADVVY